ncbi:MAG TPA: hypothetical protein VK501_27815 [Baekduia sp.]|uniref:hypothetical protein n=1 Tax=Baekduia sp. TaxID=2600305 RepID=UPI002D130000|nr:hypothetical protein [Baekduia sp.]HMJ37746.1 hypothetical protein [Baekduia sp.]
MAPTPGAPPPVDRDARRRGLALQVGVAFASPKADEDAMARLLHVAAQLEDHGARSLWLDVTGVPPDGSGLDAALAIVRRTATLEVWVGVAPEAERRATLRLAEMAQLVGGRVGTVLVVGDGDGHAGADRLPAAKPTSAWVAGGPQAAAFAAARGARWLAAGTEPQAALRAAVAAEDRGIGRPADCLGAVVRSALARGELTDGEIGATGPTSLRILLERYIAVGASQLVLDPAASDLGRWTHDVCAQVTDLDSIEPAPCGC